MDLVHRVALSCAAFLAVHKLCLTQMMRISSVAYCLS